MADNLSVIPLPTRAPANGVPAVAAADALDGTEPLLQRLVGVLEEEGLAYQRLAEVSAAKRDAMVDVDIPCLERVLADESRVVGRIHVLESARLETVEGLRQLWDLDGDEKLDLTAIGRTSGDADLAARLAGLKDRLKELALRCRALNELNQALVEQSLSHIHHFLSLLVGEAPETYGRRGLAREPQGRLLVDRQA